MESAPPTPRPVSALHTPLAVVLLAVALTGPTPAHAQAVSVYAEGLTAPQGLALDTRGWVWVTEQGTGNDDGRISFVTADGEVHPFLDGIPSTSFKGFAMSVHHLMFVDGEVWATLGQSEVTPDGFLIRADTAGFSPGDEPLSMADVTLEDVSTFVIAYPFSSDTNQSNVYGLALGTGGDLLIADAAANAVIRRAAGTGALSVFAEVPPVGPMAAVPTGVAFTGDRVFVTAFPGNPFTPGAGRVYELDLEGNVLGFEGGFTGAVDLALAPDGDLVVVEYAEFGAGFMPHTGAVVKLAGSARETLANGLNFPGGIAFDASGDFFVSAGADGQILRVTGVGTATEPEGSGGTSLRPPFPNPFLSTTSASYDVDWPAHVIVAVYDLLGREVVRLVDETRPAGPGTATWDGRDASGSRLGAGVYVVRLEVGGQTQSRKILLLR